MREQIASFRSKKAANAAARVYGAYGITVYISGPRKIKAYGPVYDLDTNEAGFKILTESKHVKAIIHGKARAAAWRAVKNKEFDGKNWAAYYAI